MPDVRTKILKLKNLNIELFAELTKKIFDCPIPVHLCPGDSGDLHCMLCSGNVLSTDELLSSYWCDGSWTLDVPALSDCPCAEETREVIVHDLYYENIYTCDLCGAVRRKCNVRVP